MDNIVNRPHFRWPKIIVVSLALILLAGIVIVSLVRDRIVNPMQNQVAVTGQGKVSYQPDIANVTLGAQIDKTGKAEDALNQLNDKINKIIAAVKNEKIPAEDIQTQNYSLSPQYDFVNNVSSLAGYSANQQLVIKVRGTDQDQNKVSRVIAAATKAGANQVLGVGFDATNVEELKQQARVKAIADAKTKAQELSRASGVKLGQIVGWWENLVQAPGTSGYYYDGKGGLGGGVGTAAAPSVPAGGQEIILEFTLNYKVK